MAREKGGTAMRMLMTVEMDTEATSRGIKDNTMPQVMESAFERFHPEAAYFTTHEGQRTAYIVLDIAEPSQMVQISEPFFSTMKAKIDWSPVMNRDDLREGLSRLER
jgi:hypothetical protein